MTALLPILLLAVPLAGCLALLALPAGARIAQPLGAAVSALTLGVALAIAAVFDYSAPQRMQLVVDVPWIPALDVRFHLGVDGISLPLVLLTALLTCCCLVYSTRILPADGRPRAFVALILLLAVGMLGTFVALDLLLFFVFFEVVLIPMYFLIAYWGIEGRGPAAYKFILYTLLGSVVMLLGFLLVYAHAGTFDMVELAARHGAGLSRTVQLLAFGAVALGFAVKTPMWPLHTWLPDAHTAAPTVGSVLLAGVLLKMGTYGFIRIAVPVLPDGARFFAPYLGAFAVVGILYGALACLAQRDLKRLIAYSSVGHMGFVLLGIATLTPAGLNGALFANVAHGLITGLLFFVAGAVKDRHRTSEFAALGGGLYERTPRLGGLLAFGAVASLGLPGLAGFWGEMLALFGAFAPGAGLPRAVYWTYLALGGLGTALTAVYLLVMVKRVCMGTTAERWRRALLLGDVTRVEVFSWGPLVVLILVAGLWPAWLLDVSTPAVGALLGGR
ncbi:NADH-quinone oxidoreductase subunit M [Carbonactinospora thermoautotrophica]|uniref:NADH-quinone oxidoreductase subunit M n=2 Tax=Carbonactinospora thermoautotrophica TaxID=1469144 RepID=A0A132MZL2_9ACTN|nr:NADH-quinone oxidoreductase subunit M [Carbonactinospora thermoautotrophica]KWX02772.1 NADH-ubiquinone oxidoreductase chain M [Carbonactinospora thermoautotrophica]KWX03806.1 NADH-quinone oxidoreductase subunit M [Carbonactinospora thermoautotrophica]MCX9190592.1 NADH-quinone oxidoreductase subunit M [Carbonactinospora thermoautotrophica]